MKVRISFTLLALLLSAASANAENLYSPKTYKPLVTDLRAYKEGDILTVMIIENSSASASAASDASKSTDVGLSASDGYSKISGDLAISNNFDGSGTIARAGQLVASVSVTVGDVYPNGDLQIHGEQLIEFNNEKQFISVEGRVRPKDIDAQNRIVSSRLADSKIQYLGEGLLSSREKPGIITRFFNWLF